MTEPVIMSSDSEPEKIELPPYVHKPLKTPDYLRLLRLRPASDEQVDIDCEIIEVPLSVAGDDVDPSNDASQNQTPKRRSSRVNSVGFGHVHWEDADSSDEGEELAHIFEEIAPAEATPGRSKAHSYEAVSWCWGRDPYNQILRVHDKDNVYAFPISQNLKKAFWALRKPNEVRQLWIDAICIDQSKTEERNQQVPRMGKIYGKATNVCIWLGEGTDDSKLAMAFIKDKVLQLWRFDELIENRKMAKQWAALIRLMKRPWFSRRWVVQEIALSPRGGILYCGKEHTTWQEFADAVSLFVEVESATHRLSDVMKLDETFGNIPDFFGDVSSLGAALLVDATSNLFRNATGGERKPLSSLEYLVSRLSVFEATQPRDIVYALLAISKDTVPQNLAESGKSQKEKNAMALAPSQGFSIQPYNVDYSLRVIDVYKEFVEFAIHKADPTTALDILCRPWAPTVLESHDNAEFTKDPSGTLTRWKEEAGKAGHLEDREMPLPSWIASLSGASMEMEEHPIAGLKMERQNADPLVGMPGFSHGNYSAAETRKVDLRKLKFVKWTHLKKEGATYPEHSMFVQGFILDEVFRVEQIAANGNIPYRWLRAGGWIDTDQNPPEEFWRTLVADRGHGGRNPPTYFPRACKESMKFKAKTMSKTRGNLDSKKLINEGRCTIVAEFLRRVQEVIWNRQLMITKNADEEGNPGNGRLGLVHDDVKPGFKVCILYGCSVPVILEEITKTRIELDLERRDAYLHWKKDVRRVVALGQARFRMKQLRRERDQKKAASEKQATAETDATPEKQATLGKQATAASGNSPPHREAWFNDQNLNQAKSAFANGTSEEEVAPPAGADELRRHNGTNGTPPLGSTRHENGGPSTPLPSRPPPPPPNDQTTNGSPSVPQTNGKSHKGKGKEFLKVEPSKVTRRLTALEERTLGEKYYLEHKAEQKKKTPPLTYFRLVGECYVHGMMNGEAIGLQNQKGIPEQTFELR